MRSALEGMRVNRFSHLVVRLLAADRVAHAWEALHRRTGSHDRNTGANGNLLRRDEGLW